jgi:hypothetical protein
MRDEEFLYQQAALNAVLQNDIVKMKENLDRLMLLKNPNFIKGVFNKFKYLGTHFFEAHSAQVDHEGLIKDLLKTAVTLKQHEITHYLLRTNELLIKPDLEDSLIWEVLFKDGQLNDIKYLLSNPNIKEKERLITNGIGCIKESNIEILNLVFDCSRQDYPEFIEKFNKCNRINSPVAVFHPFVYACSQNSISLVDFYLTKEETKPFINEITFHKGLLMAAENNNCLDVLKHLLTNPNMPIQIYKDYLADELIYMATLGNATDVLKFLIFDMNIQLEKSLDEILYI